MKKILIPLIASTIVVGSGYLGVRLFRPRAVADSPAPAEIMYVCRETGALILGPRQPTPAVNPKTGRATLAQALYCPQCGGWRAAPPAELRDRFPAGPVCPKHRAPLAESGPSDAPLIGRK